MANCLKDGADLGDEFGMATCPVCSTVYFIDADGDLSISSEPHSQPPPSYEPAGFESDLLPPLDSGFEPVQMDENFDIGQPIDIEFETPEQADEPRAPQEREPALDAFAPVNLDADAFEPPIAPEAAAEPAPTLDPGDPLGIKGYIDSEISQAKDGHLLFRVYVSGIDSKEIRESLREAMSDSRFGWDADEVLGRVQKGELKLENVSPVKASILVNRIKRLPVHIRWEQYDIKDAQI